MKIGEIEFLHNVFEFHMDADHFCVLHRGTRYYFKDEDFIDHINCNSYMHEKCLDAGTFGLEPGKLIKIPKVVLNSRDVVRANRRSDNLRKPYKKIGEEFKTYGVIEFMMFGDLLFLFYEKENMQIEDKALIKTEEGIFFPNTIKAIPEQMIEIPERIIGRRDEIRKQIEKDSHFKTILIKDNFEYILNDQAQLIIKHDGKEAIANEIVYIYNKPSINIENLELNHPYMELPTEVEKEFKKVLGLKIPKGLKLKPIGVSLLNGKEYHKLSKEISEEAFERVRYLFENFGEEKGSNLSGWLTSEPKKVAEILQLN